MNILFCTQNYLSKSWNFSEARRWMIFNLKTNRRGRGNEYMYQLRFKSVDLISDFLMSDQDMIYKRSYVFRRRKSYSILGWGI